MLVVVPGLPARTFFSVRSRDTQNAARPSVTLVTGDRVIITLAGGDRYAVHVRRGKGRDRIPVSVRRTCDGLSVVPADALPLLAAGRLDARLFDVLLQHRLGYDDGRRADLSLMVVGVGGIRARGTSAPGRRPEHPGSTYRERSRSRYGSNTRPRLWWPSPA